MTRPLRASIPADSVAGLSVASILLPQAVAYAAIAHLSIQHAIVAALAGLVCYAVVGGSRFAVVAPTSSTAALLAAAVLSLNPTGDADSSALAVGLVIMTGLGLLLVAGARLGRLSAFVSRPVLHGFSFGLALTIIINQLPILVGFGFGVNASGGNPVRLLAELLAQANHWALWSVAVGGGALALMLLLARRPKVPGALAVLALGIGLAYAVDLNELHVATVGPIALTLPSVGLPQLSMDRWLRIAELAGGLLVIVFAESWGSVRSMALLHGDAIEPNRELWAIGTSNLVSGLLQGMPVGAGFSVTAANEAAGAQSKGAAVVCAAAVLLLVLFGKSLIEHIPQPVLAAAVISALMHALSPGPLLILWRVNRDQYVALAAVAAVLAFGLLHGMLIAIALSLASAIRAFSQPVVRELAELDQSRNYIDRDSHPEARPHDKILILRPEEPLFFASVEGVLVETMARLEARSDLTVLILSLEQSADLDSTAAECLVDLCRMLERRGKTLLLARVKDPVRQLLLKMEPALFENRLFWSVADAVASATRLLQEGADPLVGGGGEGRGRHLQSQ
ncbi:SulP family inorganic anion transporter [Polaromonas sp. C04]|uniref:SulP family inorganic anion transporter n=1 Tax=Polaromonas sp. C04 TaxID=1945857 RepID=UPI0009844FD4|nr:SulP family inorganic anion transporter [Polaromonas sp. C04]